MSRIPIPFRVLAAGLMVSQAIFFAVVFRSNLDLHAKLGAMANTGFLVVPNEHVMAGLTGFSPAFFGALFFTFTTGAGLCLLGMGGAWIYRRVFGGSRWFLGFLIAVWLFSVIFANIDGFSFTATAPLAIIPLFVFLLSNHQMTLAHETGDRLPSILQAAAIVLIALVWLPKADNTVFIDIRDHVLLANPAGKAINDFYYQYTLYPAKVIKTPGQKLMAAACTSGIPDPRLKARVESFLIAHDYLPVSDSGPCDLHVTMESSLLGFSRSGKTVLETPAASFFAAPGRTLREFSERSDTLGNFRKLTFYSLFTALPLSLFILLHGLLTITLVAIPARKTTRHAVASLLCLVIGVGAALPLYFSINAAALDSPETIQASLDSSDWREQKNALKMVFRTAMDPLQFDSAGWFASSPHVPVRYWYASALGNSVKPEAYEILRQMLNDPQTNVVCMALRSLGSIGGKTGRHEATSLVENHITTSGHWYIQWYAYRALRQLGWAQNR